MHKAIFALIIINFNNIFAPPKKNSYTVSKEKAQNELKKDIIYCRDYLKKLGHSTREAQLEILNYAINLKEITLDDLLIIEYLFKANYFIDDHLDRTTLSIIDFLESTLNLLDNVGIKYDAKLGFKPENIVSYNILKKFIKYFPPIKDFKKDYRYRKDPENFLNKMTSTLGELLIKVGTLNDIFAKILYCETGDNIEFLKLIKEEININWEEIKNELIDRFNKEQLNLVARIVDEIDKYFEIKIVKENALSAQEKL